MDRFRLEKVVVVGLGYVGLPLAAALSRSFQTIGLDIDETRVRELQEGHDRTGELSPEELAQAPLTLTTAPDQCADADIYIVTVPTPVDARNEPDLRPVRSATETVARLLPRDRQSVIVYESTVYPGVTEDICGPLLAQISGLMLGQDFFLGYSPERINPGDKQHRVDNIIKVIAGQTPAVTDALATLYGAVTSAGVFRASSIKVAEAAKVIENAQRDINIAFMNEITQIFGLLGISVWDVLEAAGTKWNFLPFQPGLVGGHCIGVDPYYLSYRAQQLGHKPQVILAGRSINDDMGRWIADHLHDLRGTKAGRALVLGLTFKENVPDLRNSKAVDVIRRLRWLGYDVTVHDPLADPEEARQEYGLALTQDVLSQSFDVVVGAVAHAQYADMPREKLLGLLAPEGLLADLKGLWRDLEMPQGLRKWTL